MKTGKKTGKKTEEEAGRYQVNVYDTAGRTVLSLRTDLKYTQAKISEDMLILYNDTECEIYSAQGVLKYAGTFDTAIGDLYKAAEKILDKGLKRIFVSLGADGCLYMDREGRRIERKLKPVEKMVNATGAGDAFMAAVIYSYVNEFDIDRTIDYALAAGVAALSHEKTINPNMSVSLIEKILKERKI